MSNFLDIFTQRRTKRSKKESLPFSFVKRKKYIFFTWFGLFCWIALAGIGVFSINYNNNISIIMLCILSTFYLSVVFRNYAVLKSLTLKNIHVRPTRAHSQQHIIFEFACNRKKEIPSIWLRMGQEDIPVVFNEQGVGHAIWSPVIVESAVYELPMVYLYSLWPQGLNKTWSLVYFNAVVAVCPTSLMLQKQNGQSGKIHDEVLTLSSSGDPDGIRPLLQNERSKISWKHTLKKNKPMTYTYTASDRKIVIIPWPTDLSINDEEKIKFVSEKIDDALFEGLLFQVKHPDFTSSIGGGEGFALLTLSGLMKKVLPPQKWPTHKKQKRSSSSDGGVL